MNKSLKRILRHYNTSLLVKFFEYEIGKKNTRRLTGATGAKLDTEQNLVNVRIAMKVDGNDDIPLILKNVTVSRRCTPYIIIGTTDLRKGSSNIRYYLMIPIMTSSKRKLGFFLTQDGFGFKNVADHTFKLIQRKHCKLFGVVLILFILYIAYFYLCLMESYKKSARI